MPELPEVEVTRRGIAPALLGQTIAGAVTRVPRMRLPLDPTLGARLAGRRITDVGRRGKYLLIECTAASGERGWLIIHLGMSGHLRVMPAATPAGRHDHFDLCLQGNVHTPGAASAGALLRLHDPRRFGLVVWVTDTPEQHPLLRSLGVEPLSAEFDGGLLHTLAHPRTRAIKEVVMDSHLVVGVGNIYANESLHLAGISPLRPANRISPARYQRLATAIRETLAAAITAGGSSLRDFVHSDGGHGWFQQSYRVYGRAGAPCPACGAPVLTLRQGGRSTFYCRHCQR